MISIGKRLRESVERAVRTGAARMRDPLPMSNPRDVNTLVVRCANDHHMIAFVPWDTAIDSPEVWAIVQRSCGASTSEQKLIERPIWREKFLTLRF